MTIPDDVMKAAEILVAKMWQASPRQVVARAIMIERDRWMPIETAPKDGTFILINEYSGVVMARFEAGDWWLLCTGPDDYDGVPAKNPTHWQPLPSPPKGSTT